MKALQRPDDQEQSRGLEQDKRALLHSLIEEQVLHIVGKPQDFLKVQVRPVAQDYYRVNVFVGADAASARVGCSFFLEADHEGKITASSPALVKQY